MGSMDSYSRWPIPGTYWGEYPYGGFGGIYPGNTQQQQWMNQQAGLFQNQGWCSGPWLEGMRQIEMWKCEHCGSRFQEKPERCKNCGSNAILRFDDPGEGARQRPWSDLERHLLEQESAFLGLLGAPPGQHIKLTPEAVEMLYPKCWVSRCWQRFLRWLDRCGYRGR